MRAREHRLLGQFVRKLFESRNQRIHLRQKHFRAGFFQHQAVRGIVDILRGAGKMHELGGGFQLIAKRGHFVFEVIFHRFHVVIGGFFNVLDRLRIGLTEIGHNAVQIRHRRVRECR